MGSLGGSKSKSESKPLTPAQLQGYFYNLNGLNDGRLVDYAVNGTPATSYVGPGEAGKATTTNVAYTPTDFSDVLSPVRVGNAEKASAKAINFRGKADEVRASLAAPAREVAYNELSPEQLTAMGGLGALREATARRQSAQTLAQFAADPSLSVFQRLRANQLENQDLDTTLDALAAEREAAISQLASEQRARTLEADLSNQAAFNEGQQFNAGQQQTADLSNVDNSLRAQGMTLQGALADQSSSLEASLANAKAANDLKALQANISLQQQQLLGGLTSTEAGRVLQANLANAGAANETSQFNAQQAMTEAQRQYLAEAANAGLTREDMEALARIYFGGAGSTSTSTSSQGPLSGISVAI